MRFYCGRRQEDELVSAQWILATLKYTYFPLKQIMWTQRGSRGSWRRREEQQPSQPPASLLVEKNKTFFSSYASAKLLPISGAAAACFCTTKLAFELNVSLRLSSYILELSITKHLMQSSRGKCIGQFCKTNWLFKRLRFYVHILFFFLHHLSTISILTNFHFCLIFNLDPFSILSNFQFVQICPILSIKFCSFFIFVHFSMLSNFSICSISSNLQTILPNFCPTFWFCPILSRAVHWNFQSCFHYFFAFISQIFNTFYEAIPFLFHSNFQNGKCAAFQLWTPVHFLVKIRLFSHSTHKFWSKIWLLKIDF